MSQTVYLSSPDIPCSGMDRGVLVLTRLWLGSWLCLHISHRMQDGHTLKSKEIKKGELKSAQRTKIINKQKSCYDRIHWLRLQSTCTCKLLQRWVCCSCCSWGCSRVIRWTWRGLAGGLLDRHSAHWLQGAHRMTCGCNTGRRSRCTSSPPPLLPPHL